MDSFKSVSLDLIRDIWKEDLLQSIARVEGLERQLSSDFFAIEGKWLFNTFALIEMKGKSQLLPI